MINIPLALTSESLKELIEALNAHEDKLRARVFNPLAGPCGEDPMARLRATKEVTGQVITAKRLAEETKTP